jgi:hypothetical protein
VLARVQSWRMTVSGVEAQAMVRAGPVARCGQQGCLVRFPGGRAARPRQPLGPFAQAGGAVSLCRDTAPPRCSFRGIRSRSCHVVTVSRHARGACNATARLRPTAVSPSSRGTSQCGASRCTAGSTGPASTRAVTFGNILSGGCLMHTLGGVTTRSRGTRTSGTLVLVVQQRKADGCREVRCKSGAAPQR